MALPTTLTTGYVPQRYGVRVMAMSTDPTFGLELQHATASNAPTSQWVSQRMSPYASVMGSFIIELPYTTQLRYFRARSWKPGYTDSAFTTVVSGRPQALTQLLPHVSVGQRVIPPLINTRNRCKCHHSATQSILNLTPTYLSFDTDDYNTGAIHNTAVNNSRITVPSIANFGNVGVWALVAEVAWDLSAAGYREVDIIKNRTTILATTQLPLTGSAAVACIQTVMAFDDAPSVGDYYEVRGTQSSGGALNVGVVDVHYTFFSATHLW